MEGLAAELLEARDLEDVRRVVASREPADLEDAVEPLAAEVLRMMRTDARRALEVADRATLVAEATDEPRLRARAAWMRAHGLSGVLRNREACDSYEAAAAAFRDLGDVLQEAKVTIGWVNALMYLGDYAKALSLGARARRAFLRGGLHPEAARLDLNLGNIHHRVERPHEAMRKYDRALVAAKKIGDPVMVRVVQFNRANVLTSLGKMADAEKLYQQVKEEAEAAGELRTAGFAEYSLGYLHLLRGDYGRAHERLEASRTVFEDLGDPHYLTLALTDLAELFVEVNGFRRAKNAGRGARAMAERHGIRFEAARSALFEGIACLGLDELDHAAICLEDARSAFRQEGNRVSGAVCALYLAELDTRRGRSAEAADKLRRAVSVFEEEGLPLREATARIRLAGVQIDRERPDDAREEIARARRALRRAPSPWLRAQADHLAGRLALREERFGLATRQFRSAVQRIESLRGRIGVDEFRISFGEDKAPVYADLVHALLRRGGKDAVAEAFETVERARSRALVDQLAGRLSGAREAADPAVAKLVARLEALRAELNWRSGFDPEPRKGRRDEARLLRSGPEIRRIEAEMADVVQRLQSKDRALGALTAGETTTLAEVREGLGDATLVEYFVSGHGTVAFVVTRDDARVVALEPDADDIVDHMGRLRFQMEKWGYGDEYVAKRGPALREALDRQLAQLARGLWDPLEVTGRRVVLVPHGPLHSLPFHALTDPDGRPLMERHVFSWLPSASARRYLGGAAPSKPGKFRDARVLAVGVSDDSIPQVEREIERVRAQFRRGRILRGPRATRSRLLREAARADVVHVATHGVFREDDPHFSALRLADGWMSLYDFYGMRTEAGLVCLSACQSGRSWTGAGDELVGLARGFLHAGARTLVVSLWPVHDDSTQLLMESFYRGLRSGRPSEEALRDAMRELREDRPHPYHWAPFVLMGRGGPVGPGS